MPFGNAKEAIEPLLSAFNEKRPLEEALIKEFQYKLTQNTYDQRRRELGERPGEFKLRDYVTGKNEIGAPPEDVKEDRKTYYDALEARDEKQELDPLIEFFKEQTVKTRKKQIEAANRKNSDK